MTMRALTGVLALTLMAAAVHAQAAADAKPLFEPCADVLTTAEVESLGGELSREGRESASCLRLTNNEFVVFNGGGTTRRLFQYCDARRVPACEWEPFSPYAFDVVREFTGANGEQFLLWKTHQYHRGVHDHGYGIVSLVPKSADHPRGFAIYALVGGTLFKGEDSPLSDPCQDLGDEVNDITGYELSGEGTSDVELRFTERVVDCKTRKEKLWVNRFRPQGGKFELVP